MSGGHIVLVKNPPGGEVAKEIWFAHLGDMDKAVHAVETTSGAARSQIVVVGTVRHAVLIDHFGVPEGEVIRFDGSRSKENPG